MNNNVTIYYSKDKPALSYPDFVIKNFFINPTLQELIYKKFLLVFPSETDVLIMEDIFNKWTNVINCIENLQLNIEYLSIGNIFENKYSSTYTNFQKDESFKTVTSLKLNYTDIIKLKKLYELNKQNNSTYVCVITKDIMLNYTVPKNIPSVKITQGEKIVLETLLSTLASFGYVRKNYVENIGEFALRGEIFDLWLNGKINTEAVDTNILCNSVRILLDDNIVKEIRFFDIATQRSWETKSKLKEVEIFPVKLSNQLETSNNIMFRNIFEEGWFVINFNESDSGSKNHKIINDYYKTSKFYGHIEGFITYLQQFRQQNYKIVIGYSYDYELDKIKEIFASNTQAIKFCQTELYEGFWNKKEKFLFTTYTEIFTKYGIYYPKIKKENLVSFRLENVWEIQKDDYVVHQEYGIGKFLGIQKISYGDKTAEFLSILYRDNAKLYVPVTEFYKVDKYVSFSSKPPQLSYIDQSTWQRTTKKIKESLKEFVVELYHIYTQRKQIKRPETSKCLPDTELEKQLEQSFGYQETDDQLKAINDVKKDMCSEFPMDRVIVGDVGFGKTEVALRAAFKAVVNSKQVLFLCPTTILAEQHYRTFVDRLSAFAVNVGIVTRLQSKKEIQQTLENLRQGKIDIVIGTHLLLNDKVKFKNLGLVIIDEEHKFGVKQKEIIRLKYRNLQDKISQDNCNIPDVLSLTATPIPRTLAFSLQGIKDISLIETPPPGRLPIETFVLAYDENIVLNAISRELYRDGQIYYVYNNIDLIQHKTNFLKQHFPNVSIEYIHSKLPAKKIEDIMLKFINQQIQCLVTTTIIESGLDIPNVNTIIVEHAEKFGLAQLYQLRGRVGRRDKKAYCYFLYFIDNLSENAKKRLSALLEFSYLGSGFRLALRDLEIRGAGELLGTKQHGFVNEIGLEAYSKIIQEILYDVTAGKEGLKTVDFPDISELPIEAYFPEEYIPDDETRIMFYKKLLQAQTIKEIEEIKKELEDRFGKIKDKKIAKVTDNLFKLSALKLYLKQYGIKKISVDKENNECIFHFTSLDNLSQITEKLRNLNLTGLEIKHTVKNILLKFSSWDSDEKLLGLLETFFEQKCNVLVRKCNTESSKKELESNKS